MGLAHVLAQTEDIVAEQLRMKTLIAATPRKVYEAWVDPRRHAAFTESRATGGMQVGDPFTAWEGYIQGVQLELVPGRRIVQSWRTSDFPAGTQDSRLEIALTSESGKTRLTLVQTNIPDGQAEQYRQGWIDFYFAPLKKYLKEAEAARKAPAKAKPRIVRGKRITPKAKAKAKAKPRARSPK
jgi:uncharacterized protein YndB with AHSA1/START domain